MHQGLVLRCSAVPLWRSGGLKQAALALRTMGVQWKVGAEAFVREWGRTPCWVSRFVYTCTHHIYTPTFQ